MLFGGITMKEKKHIQTYNSCSAENRFGIKCIKEKVTEDVPLHRHDYFAIGYLTKGEILHTINGVEATLTRGDVYLLSPFDLHSITLRKSAELTTICINYQEINSILQKLVSSVEYPRIAKLTNKELLHIEALFSEIIEKRSKYAKYTSEILTANSLLIISTILNASVSCYYEAAKHSNIYILKAIDYISKNYANSITLNDVSDYLNLTPNYFSSLFTKANGTSFVSLLTEVRIKKAVELLSSTDHTITEIAYETGFGSFSSFSRAFKSICGSSPNEYRKYGSTTDSDILADMVEII